MKFTSLILITCLVFQTFSSLSFVAYYQVQKDYIEEVFCINKDKPMMNCEGKCYLSQKLKEQQESQKDTPVIPEIQTVSYLIEDFNSELSKRIVIVSKNFDGYIMGLISNYIPSIFHPPKN